MTWGTSWRRREPAGRCALFCMSGTTVSSKVAAWRRLCTIGTGKWQASGLAGGALNMAIFRSALIGAAIWLVLCAVGSAADGPDFSKDVAPILTKYCTGCHNDTDREGKLSLQTYQALLNGGAKGGV